MVKFYDRGGGLPYPQSPWAAVGNIGGGVLEGMDKRKQEALQKVAALNQLAKTRPEILNTDLYKRETKIAGLPPFEYREPMGLEQIKTMAEELKPLGLVPEVEVDPSTGRYTSVKYRQPTRYYDPYMLGGSGGGFSDLDYSGGALMPGEAGGGQAANNIQQQKKGGGMLSGAANAAKKGVGQSYDYLTSNFNMMPTAAPFPLSYLPMPKGPTQRQTAIKPSLNLPSMIPQISGTPAASELPSLGQIVESWKQPQYKTTPTKAAARKTVPSKTMAATKPTKQQQYKIGQVIKVGNISYKVVGFDTDGEPLVEKQ